MKITIKSADYRFDHMNKQFIITNGTVTFKDDAETNKVKLASLNIGDEFYIGSEISIILDKTADGIKVISKEFVYNIKFGDSSDWKESLIRVSLNNEYYNKIAESVGADNIILMERGLISLDGLDDYGTCNDKISLLSAIEYAKYHKIFGLNSNYSDWWWTLTPISTPSNGYPKHICVINTFGILNWTSGNIYCKVRPFFMLNAETLVLQKKKDND